MSRPRGRLLLLEKSSITCLDPAQSSLHLSKEKKNIHHRHEFKPGVTLTVKFVFMFVFCSYSVLFCSVLFCSVLFCSVL
jgi:hypothetical protein